MTVIHRSCCDVDPTISRSTTRLKEVVVLGYPNRHRLFECITVSTGWSEASPVWANKLDIGGRVVVRPILEGQNATRGDVLYSLHRNYKPSDPVNDNAVTGMHVGHTNLIGYCAPLLNNRDGPLSLAASKGFAGPPRRSVFCRAGQSRGGPDDFASVAGEGSHRLCCPR